MKNIYTSIVMIFMLGCNEESQTVYFIPEGLAVSWEDAQAQCQENGASLADIDYGRLEEMYEVCNQDGFANVCWLNKKDEFYPTIHWGAYIQYNNQPTYKLNPLCQF